LGEFVKRLHPNISFIYFFFNFKKAQFYVSKKLMKMTYFAFDPSLPMKFVTKDLTCSNTPEALKAKLKFVY
jgi:hypothetical protein